MGYVRKTGAGAQSAFTTVKQSPGPNVDFSCSPCRWGDYSGATPDPSPANTDGHGTVWLTGMWASGTQSRSSAVWRSWNWSVAI